MLPFLFAQAEPSALDLGAQFAQAVHDKQYAVVVIVLLMGGIWLARWGGAKVWPWLGTPRGGAVLVVLGGTGTLLLGALKAGQPLSVELVLGCFLTAANAAGLWSLGKNVIQKAPTQAMAPERCTPIEIANGTCKP